MSKRISQLSTAEGSPRQRVRRRRLLPAATGIVPGREMTASGEGVRVASMQPGSGTEAAGIKPGDRLLALGGGPQACWRWRMRSGTCSRGSRGGEFARDDATLHSTLRLGEQ